jgi:hypothetical protein
MSNLKFKYTKTIGTQDAPTIEFVPNLWLIVKEIDNEYLQFPANVKEIVEKYGVIFGELFLIDLNQETMLCSAWHTGYHATSVRNTIARWDTEPSSEDKEVLHDFMFEMGQESIYFDTILAKSIISRAVPGTTYHIGVPDIDYDDLEGDGDDERYNNMLQEVISKENSNHTI